MKAKHILCLIIVISAFAFSKKYNSAPAIDSKEWRKSWGKVQDGQWMQKTEVSNGNFRMFLNSLKAEGKMDAYHQYFPDTLGWKKDGPSNKPFVSFYFSHTAFSNYPVVNVSYEAANAYCKWLGEQYAKLDKQPFGKVEFKLPTQKEWQFAAASGKNDNRRLPWNGNYFKNNRGERLCNYNLRGDTTITQDAGEKKFNQAVVGLPAPVNSFFPNDIGLYNTSGNVAEMVQEKGIVAGGSYSDPAGNVFIHSTKTYTSSSPDIGFRVMMVTAK